MKVKCVYFLNLCLCRGYYGWVGLFTHRLWTYLYQGWAGYPAVPNQSGGISGIRQDIAGLSVNIRSGMADYSAGKKKTDPEQP